MLCNSLKILDWFQLKKKYSILINAGWGWIHTKFNDSNSIKGVPSLLKVKENIRMTRMTGQNGRTLLYFAIPNSMRY